MGDENKDEFTPSKLQEELKEMRDNIAAIPGQIAEGIKSALEPLTNAPTKSGDNNGNGGESQETQETQETQSTKTKGGAWSAWFGDNHG